MLSGRLFYYSRSFVSFNISYNPLYYVPNIHYCSKINNNLNNDFSFSSSLQKILSKEINNNLNIKYNLKETIYLSKIKNFIKKQDLQGSLQFLSKIKQNTNDCVNLSNIIHSYTLYCIGNTCRYDNNANSYIELVLRSIIKYNNPLQLSTIESLIKAYISIGKIENGLAILKYYKSYFSRRKINELYEYSFEEALDRDEISILHKIYHLYSEKEFKFIKNENNILLRYASLSNKPSLYKSIIDNILNNKFRKLIDPLEIPFLNKKDLYLHKHKIPDFIYPNIIKQYNSKHISSIIQTYNKFGYKQNARALYLHSQHRTIDICSSYLETFYNLKDKPNITQILNRIEKFRYNIDVNMLIYRPAINYFLRIGDLRRAKQLYKIALHEGCIPNHWVYLDFIHFYYKANNIGGMNKMFDELESNGLYFLYTHLHELCTWISLRNTNTNESIHQCFLDRLYKYTKYYTHYERSKAFHMIAAAYAKLNLFNNTIDIIDEMIYNKYSMSNKSFDIILEELAKHQSDSFIFKYYSRFIRSSLYLCIPLEYKHWMILLENCVEHQLTTIIKFILDTEYYISPDVLNYMLVTSTRLNKIRSVLPFYYTQVQKYNEEDKKECLSSSFRKYFNNYFITNNQKILNDLRDNIPLSNFEVSFLFSIFYKFTNYNMLYEILLYAYNNKNIILNSYFILKTLQTLPIPEYNYEYYKIIANIMINRYNKYLDKESLKNIDAYHTISNPLRYEQLKEEYNSIEYIKELETYSTQNIQINNISINDFPTFNTQIDIKRKDTEKQRLYKQIIPQ